MAKKKTQDAGRKAQGGKKKGEKSKAQTMRDVLSELGKRFANMKDGEQEAEWNRRQVELEEKARKARTLSTTMLQPDDRMMRYRKNPPCPKCGAQPTVCMMRRKGYELRRCRQCGHRWEIKEQKTGVRSQKSEEGNG